MIFLKFSAKTVLCGIGYVFNKIHRGEFQKLDMQLGHRAGLVEDYC